MTGSAGRYPDGLAEALSSLDVVLGDRVRRARGGAVGTDPLSAYYVPDAEVDALLAEGPGRTADGRPVLGGVLAAGSRPPERLARLALTFGLAPLDVEALLVCLAPEVDRRYERLYGYLQDDITRQRPSVDLILDLCCPGPDARLAGRLRFGPTAPLSAYRLVTVEEEHGRAPGSMLGRAVRLTPRVTDFLLDPDAGGQLDASLTGIAQLLRTGPSPGAGAGAGILQLPRLVLFLGPDPASRRAPAEAWCAAAGAPLLVLRGDRLDTAAEALPELLSLAVREARLHRAAVYLDRADRFLIEDRTAELAPLIEPVAGPAPCPPVFVGAAVAWPGNPDGPVPLQIDVPLPGRQARARLWRAAITDLGLTLAGDADLDGVAASFRLGTDRIAAAAATAGSLAAIRSPEDARIGPVDLLSACRRHADHGIARLAEQIEPRRGWDDLILPDEATQQLRELHDQVRLREKVHHDWGFADRLGTGIGLNVLFVGPPGTGKTMAAEVLAGSLGLGLYRIDLSSTVSKYIGETEKNLARLFEEAAGGDAILFFDEADAVFGKRTQVRDAHDRYANLETSYLLQRLETHTGVVILATNLRKNMDDAFVRRLHVTVEFAVPGESDRRRIWERMFPAAAPLGPDVDLDLLAQRIDLAGGHLRNIALGAAFLAAADSLSIGMAHLGRAARREYRKLGTVVSDDELEELVAPAVVSPVP